jgi:hypothetical protein
MTALMQVVKTSYNCGTFTGHDQIVIYILTQH